MNLKSDIEINQMFEGPTQEEIKKVDQEIDTRIQGQSKSVKIPKDLLNYKYKLEQHLHKLDLQKDAKKQAGAAPAAQARPNQAQPQFPVGGGKNPR